MSSSSSSKNQSLLFLLVLLGLVATSTVQAFISPAIWSRIHSHLRLYGRQQEQPLSVTAATSPFRRGLSFGERMTALRATAPMSFGDYGSANGDDLTFAEMREQLGALESQLAGAMELGK